MSTDFVHHRRSVVEAGRSRLLVTLCIVVVVSGCVAKTPSSETPAGSPTGSGPASDDLSPQNLAAGQQIFRFETFGNEGFWTDAARLPKGMMDAKFTPKQALEAGLQVDIEAIDPAMRKVMEAELKTSMSPKGAPTLNDPKTTVALVSSLASSRRTATGMGNWTP